MKKTLAAVAVLGAFAGSALAADVTLYGKIDTGLMYSNTKVDQIIDGQGNTDSVSDDGFQMKSGINSGSRFGIKGSEQISDGLTVGFQLENGFESDDGSMKYGKEDNDRIFGREARLYVQTEFGTLHFGRMGGLDSGSGSVDIFGGAAGVFGSGWADIGSDSAIFLGMSSRMDNVITYQSPKFAGVTVYAQASLKNDADNEGDEGSSDTDRYYALGATGQWGALSSAVVFSTTDYSRSWINEKDKEGNRLDKEQGREDMSKVLSAYVAYDFGVVKTTLGAQYFDDAKGGMSWEVADGLKDPNDYATDLANYSKKGYGVMLGATAPIGAGTLYASIGYNDFEATEVFYEDKPEFNTIQFGLGYTYPLSKRTYVYTAAGYTKLSGEYKSEYFDFEGDNETTEVVAGIVHSF